MLFRVGMGIRLRFFLSAQANDELAYLPAGFEYHIEYIVSSRNDHILHVLNMGLEKSGHLRFGTPSMKITLGIFDAK